MREIKKCAPPKTIYERIDKTRVSFEDDQFISQKFITKLPTPFSQTECQENRKNSRLNWQKISNTLYKKLIEEKAEIKYFDSRSVANLPRRKQFNNFEKMACGLEALKSMKKPLPIETKMLIMNALVISHLHYPAILQKIVSSTWKTVNFGKKTCCDCVKFDSSSDLVFKCNC